MTNTDSNLPPLPKDEALLRLMPNLFVIGASKSGSSALHAYLRPLPGVAMSKEKEPCFFVDQTQLEEAWPIMARQPCSHDWEAYLRLWEGGEQATYRGEGSVYYSQAPHRSDIPARIASVCPEARIIYTVREPVSRAIGHYWQRFKEFQEKRPIEEAIKADPLFRDTSDYALQLNAYLEHFDRSQIFVLVAEDLRSKRRETLEEIISWLGLPPYNYTDAEIDDVHKSPPTSRKERFPVVAALRNSGAWAAIRKVLPTGAVKYLRKQATVEFDKADVDESGARAYLADYLAPKVVEFEALMGRDLPGWHKAIERYKAG